jgi:hypothetical protein
VAVFTPGTEPCSGSRHPTAIFLAAEGIYFLAANGVITVLGSGSDPFQPSVIPFNVGAVTCGYLAGVALVQQGRSRQARAVVRSGSENACGIYLSHMLFIIMLARVGWGRLTSVIPWPVLCLVTVAIVFAFGMALTSFLARTPLAVPLTGRTRVPWRRPRFPAAHPAASKNGINPLGTSDAGGQLCCWPGHRSRSRAAGSRPWPSRSGRPSGCRGPGVCSPASSGQGQQVRIRDSC